MPRALIGPREFEPVLPIRAGDSVLVEYDDGLYEAEVQGWSTETSVHLVVKADDFGFMAVKRHSDDRWEHSATRKEVRFIL